MQRIIGGRNRSLPHVATRPDFPLRTFVRCSNCDQPLTGSFSRGRSKYYGYYHCNNRRCDVRGYHPLDEVHEEFAQFLDGASASSHAIEHLKDYIRQINEQVRSQANTLEQRREAENRRRAEQVRELIRMKMENLITEGEFLEQRKILAQAMASKPGGEFTDPGAIDSALADVDKVTPYLRSLGNAWKRVKPQFQRRFQQLLIPGGYAVGNVGTAPKGHLLSFLALSLPADTHVVPPVGESWNQLLDEIGRLAAVFGTSDATH